MNIKRLLYMNPERMPDPSALSVGVLIRFADSASTLPAVLQALQKQTRQPEVLLGIDSGSTDGSDTLLEQAGAQVVRWPFRYEHAKVLNYALTRLSVDLVLVLSSHTVLEDPTTVERMVACFHDDPRTACVSLRWDADPFYSEVIDWEEVQTKGLKFGAIYSNSMGMLRRSLWEQRAFDEALETAEDYAWALWQLKEGHTCRRLALPFSYQRSGHGRDYEFARVVFRLAHAFGLKVAWLGAWPSVKGWLATQRRQPTTARVHRARLAAWGRALLGWA